MTKEELKEKIIKAKNKYKVFSRSKEVLKYEKYINKYTVNFDKYNSSLGERIWSIINCIEDRPLCPICANYLKHIDRGKYTLTCSRKCGSILSNSKISKEQKEEISLKISKAVIKYKNNLSKEQKEEISSKRRNTINNFSEEKKIQYKNRLSESSKIIYNNLTDNEKTKRKNKRQITLSEFSKEKRVKINDKIGTTTKNFSEEKKLEIALKKQSTWAKRTDEQNYYSCKYNGRNLIKIYTHNKKGLEKGFLYCIELKHNEEIFYKIGMTSRSIEKRFGQIKHYTYKIIQIIEMTNLECAKIEYNIHKNNEHIKYKPNIKFDGRTECYSEPIKLKHTTKELQFDQK